MSHVFAICQKMLRTLFCNRFFLTFVTKTGWGRLLEQRRLLRLLRYILYCMWNTQNILLYIYRFTERNKNVKFRRYDKEVKNMKNAHKCFTCLRSNILWLLCHSMTMMPWQFYGFIKMFKNIINITCSSCYSM